MALVLLNHHTPYIGGTGNGERDKNLASVERTSKVNHLTILGALLSRVR